MIKSRVFLFVSWLMAFKTSALIIWNKSFPYCWRSCGEVACTWFCNDDVSSLLISSLLRAKKALICKMKTTHSLVLSKLRRSFSKLPTHSMSKMKENCMHGYEHVHMAIGILEKGKILQNTHYKLNMDHWFLKKDATPLNKVIMC